MSSAFDVPFRMFVFVIRGIGGDAYDCRRPLPVGGCPSLSACIRS